MSDEELDLVLRSRLGALHGEAQAPLGDDALARVIAAVQRESVRLSRARRLRRVAFGSGGLLLAAAASWFLFIAPQRQAPDLARSVQAECALPFGAAVPGFTRAPDGRQVLSLGVLGQLFADPSAALQVESASACELSVRLTQGVLAGDLTNLKPAVLHIRTQFGEVVVRGTRFSVEADGGMQVVLLSGTVDVLSPDKTVVHLSPGKTLRKSSAAAALQIGPASTEHARKLDALLASATASAAPEPVAPSATDAGSAVSRAQAKPAKSTADLLGAAEAERRSGRLPEARALYREAGARSDENAEVALLRWARLELDERDTPAAHAVLKQYQRRFPKGRLGTEAAWLEVRALSALGKTQDARAAAERLIERYPTTPQARAARQLLDSP
jgi:tetratricopeptide (TPR) repeat protein